MFDKCRDDAASATLPVVVHHLLGLAIKSHVYASSPHMSLHDYAIYSTVLFDVDGVKCDVRTNWQHYPSRSPLASAAPASSIHYMPPNARYTHTECSVFVPHHH